MAAEKKRSTAAKASKVSVQAASSDATSTMDKLKAAHELMERTSADVENRKSEKQKDEKRLKQEAKLRADEDKKRRANDERQARLIAEQRLEALTYAENYRKKLMRDQQRAASAKKVLLEEKKAAEEAQLREERAKELSELMERERTEAAQRAEKANALLEKLSLAREKRESAEASGVTESENEVDKTQSETPVEDTSFAENITADESENTAPATETAPEPSESLPGADDDGFVIKLDDSADSDPTDDDGKLVIDPEAENPRVVRIDENGECVDDSEPDSAESDASVGDRDRAFEQQYFEQMRALQYAQYMDGVRRYEEERRRSEEEAKKREDAYKKIQEAEERRISEFEDRMKRLDDIMRRYEESRVSALKEFVDSLNQTENEVVAAAESPSATADSIADESASEGEQIIAVPETVLQSADDSSEAIAEIESDEAEDTVAEIESDEAEDTVAENEYADTEAEVKETENAVADTSDAVIHRLITAANSTPRVQVVNEEGEDYDKLIEDAEAVLDESDLANGESASAIVEEKNRGVRDMGFERAIEYMDREMLPRYLAKNDRESRKFAAKVKKAEKKQVRSGSKTTGAAMLVDSLNAQKRVIDIESDSLNNCCYIGTKRGIRRYEKRVDMAVVDYNRLADDYQALCGVNVKRPSLTTSDLIISGQLPEVLPTIALCVEDVAVLKETAADPVSPFGALDKRGARELIAANGKKLKVAKRDIEKLGAKKKKLQGADRTECIVNTICTQRSVVMLCCDSLGAACFLKKAKLIKLYRNQLSSEIASYNAFVEEYEYFTSDKLTHADVDIPERIISGENYTPIPMITYTREDVSVIKEGEKSVRRAVSSMDKRILERYLAASREEEKKARRNFKKLEKKRAHATIDEQKAECIVASLTAKKRIVDLLCRNLECAVAVLPKSRYVKRLKKALSGDIQDYNKIVDSYEEQFNDTLTRADVNVPDCIIGGTEYAVLPTLTYYKEEPKVEPDALSAKKAATVTGIIDRKHFSGYATNADKRLSKLTKEYRRNEKSLAASKSREDKAEYIVKCLSTRRLMIELTCEVLDTACGVNARRSVKKYKKKLNVYTAEYNKLVDVYEDGFNDILTRASETVADDIIAGKDYEIPPVLTYHRTDVRETKASRRENRSMKLAGAMERRRLPKYLLANDKKISQNNKKLAELKRSYERAITDEDKAECTVKRLTLIKDNIEIQCDSLSGSCHARAKRYIRRYRKHLATAVAGYNSYVDKYAKITGEALTKAPETLPSDITLGRRYIPLPTLVFNSRAFDAEDAALRAEARRELRKPQMSISEDVIAKGKLEKQIKSQSDKDLTTITKYATHKISMLERERDVERVSFGRETGKTKRTRSDIAKSIKKIKKWHKQALACEVADNKRYYEIVSLDPATAKFKRSKADSDVLASLRARLIQLLNERDELNGKLIAIYSGEDVNTATESADVKYRQLQNKAANKSYKKQKSLAKTIKSLHVNEDEKDRIYELMNRKVQLESNVQLYTYKLKKEKGDARTNRQLRRDIKRTRREIKRINSDIKYLMGRAKDRDAKSRGGSWMMAWGVMLLIIIGAAVAGIYFFGDQLRPIIESFLGGAK